MTDVIEVQLFDTPPPRRRRQALKPPKPQPPPIDDDPRWHALSGRKGVDRFAHLLVGRSPALGSGTALCGAYGRPITLDGIALTACRACMAKRADPGRGKPKESSKRTRRKKSTRRTA